MVKTRTQVKRIVARFLKVLEARGVAVERAVVFGSYASGTPTAYSDIDIAVIAPLFDSKGMVERQELLGEAAVLAGGELDAIGYGSIESRGDRSSFLEEILHSGQLVYSAA